MHGALMDAVNGGQMPLIEFFQQKLYFLDDQIVFISILSKPENILNILFPIIASFNTMLAAELLFVNVIANWSNLIAKWIFHEDRPFWWVNEVVSYKGNYALRQYPITCETSPGFPSGHVTTTACTLYVLFHYFIRNCKELKTMLWTIYGIAIILVAVSRSYVAAHFPHQCLIAALVGYQIAHYCIARGSKYNAWKKWTKCSMFTLFLYLFSFTFSSYWLMKLIGYDPQKSVKLAFKWCERPEYVNVASTPLYGFVSTFGSLAAFVFLSPIFKKVPSGGMRPLIGLIASMGVVGMCNFIQPHIPTHSVWIFYSGIFLLSMTQAMLLLCVVPGIAGIRKARN